MPRQFPVFSKPIFNFAGMGAGSRVLVDAADYQRHNTAGHLWMPLLDGPHISTDAAVVDGNVAWMRHATGLPTRDGMFDYWTVHATAMPALDARLTTWIAGNLAGYTGIINLETIGGVIIDAHLRFADQWPDLYGPGWVEALIALYRDQAWVFDEPARDGYSLALFVAHGRRYRHPPDSFVAEVAAMRGVSSVQITFHADRPPDAHSMPPGGFRVALVNAWDLEAGKLARRRLARWFETASGST